MDLKPCPCMSKGRQVTIFHLLVHHSNDHERMARWLASPLSMDKVMDDVTELWPGEMDVWVDETDETRLDCVCIGIAGRQVAGHGKTVTVARQIAMMHALLLIMAGEIPIPESSQRTLPPMRPARPEMSPGFMPVLPNSLPRGASADRLCEHYRVAHTLVLDMRSSLTRGYLENPISAIIDFNIEHPWLSYNKVGPMIRACAMNANFECFGEANGLLDARKSAILHLAFLEIERKLYSKLGIRGSDYVVHRTDIHRKGLANPKQKMDITVDYKYLAMEFAPQRLLVSCWHLPHTLDDLMYNGGPFLETYMLQVPTVTVAPKPHSNQYRALGSVKIRNHTQEFVADGRTPDEAHTIAMYHAALLLIRGDFSADDSAPDKLALTLSRSRRQPVWNTVEPVEAASAVAGRSPAGSPSDRKLDGGSFEQRKYDKHDGSGFERKYDTYQPGRSNNNGNNGSNNNSNNDRDRGGYGRDAPRHRATSFPLTAPATPMSVTMGTPPPPPPVSGPTSSYQVDLAAIGAAIQRATAERDPVRALPLLAELQATLLSTVINVHGLVDKLAMAATARGVLPPPTMPPVMAVAPAAYSPGYHPRQPLGGPPTRHHSGGGGGWLAPDHRGGH
ncbi:hypothetical protein BC828DRAFT_386356 [Blastocladiella britannica]|nr:hypothetical protein BC828DRAFT_386356 [Blastocladiella britannica]